MAGLALSMTFVVKHQVPDPVPAGFTPWQVIWTADQDPQAADGVIARNARVGAALAARFGQVAETPRGQLDPEELMLLSDDALPPEAMIHRLARRSAWTFRPEGPVSEVSLCLFDGMATIDMQIADAAPAHHTDIAALVDRIAEVLQHEAAMSLWDYQRSGVVADAPGERAVNHAGGMLDRQARTERNAALRHRAGPAVAILLTLAFVVGTFAAMRLGLDSAGLAAVARTSPVETFVTLEVPQTGLPRLLPDYALIGTVNGNSIRLPVGRPEYIRAAVGARFSVISTGDAGRPYVLLSQVGSTTPTVPVFGGRTLPLHSLLIVVGLSALWVATVLRPLLSRPARFDQITRSGIALSKSGGALAAAVLAGLILRRYF
jgi:hypothetical protein